MKFMEEIKSHSSKWIKDMDDRYRNFYWQNGYGAFSVSPSELEDVKTYIDAQRDHHHETTFQDEFRNFLRLYNVDYDERYVWD